MLSFIFMILLASIFARLSLFAFKAAWTIGKILISIVFFPLIIVFVFFRGILAVAWPLLICYGIYCLIKTTK